MNDCTDLYCLSSLDGRYVSQTAPLRTYFSEFALMKYRVRVELLYLLFLSKRKIFRTIKPKEKIILYVMMKSFSEDDAKRIKQFESKTKHDVKALEYFLKEKLGTTTLSHVLPFVHFGITSDDTNNLAYALMLADFHKHIFLPEIYTLLSAIRRTALVHVNSVMLAKTHGQPAIPTTFGKELAVYYSRLKTLEKKLQTFRFDGKMNGAVGNYNALAWVLPKIDWIKFSSQFITSLGLTPNLTSTQILPYDRWIEYTSIIAHANAICIGFCQDMWQYISAGLVVQKRDAKQVGSSTMPHKVNPINFENAEGNLQIANAYFELYSRKLLISRMQRDLSDSTVKRTIGTALGHTILAWKSLQKGLAKIAFDADAARGELDEHWEILSEAVQIYLKWKGDSAGFEKVKALTMGKRLDEKSFRLLVKQFPALAKLTPTSYSGLAKKLAKLALKS